MRGVQLLGEGDVGVDDPPAHPRDRLAVAQPARVQHGVDRERQRLQRREQQLGAARELGLLGQRAHPEHRLIASGPPRRRSTSARSCSSTGALAWRTMSVPSGSYAGCPSAVSTISALGSQ